MGIFELASRAKLRFDYKGVCTVEDLWDLPLTALDVIFKQLNQKVKFHNEESLLTKKTPEIKKVELQLEIVKHIFNIKNEENEIKLAQKQKAELKQKLMKIYEEKQDEEFRIKSREELKKMIEEIE